MRIVVRTAYLNVSVVHRLERVLQCKFSRTTGKNETLVKMLAHMEKLEIAVSGLDDTAGLGWQGRNKGDVNHKVRSRTMCIVPST